MSVFKEIMAFDALRPHGLGFISSSLHELKAADVVAACHFNSGWLSLNTNGGCCQMATRSHLDQNASATTSLKIGGPINASLFTFFSSHPSADVPVGPPGLPLPKLRWDGSKKDDYVSHLRKSGTAIAECKLLVSTGDPSAAFAKLGEVLIDAAKAAGCKHVDGSSLSRLMPLEGLLPSTLLTSVTSHILTRNVDTCERSSDLQ